MQILLQFSRNVSIIHPLENIVEVGCGDGNVFSVIVFNLDSGETLEGQWSR